MFCVLFDVELTLSKWCLGPSRLEVTAIAFRATATISCSAYKRHCEMLAVLSKKHVCLLESGLESLLWSWSILLVDALV